MPVIEAPSSSPNALQNISAFFDWMMDELVTNYRFVQRYESVDIPGNSFLRWIERPSSECWNPGVYPLLIGLATADNHSPQNPEGANAAIAGSYVDYVTAGSPTNFNFAGMPGARRRNGGGYDSRQLPGIFDAGGTGFVRGRLVISEDADQAAPTRPVYCYAVIEVSTNVYVSFGFGELVPLIPQLSGGFFVAGSGYDQAGSNLDGSGISVPYGSRPAQQTSSSFDGYRPAVAAWVPGWHGLSDIENGFEWFVDAINVDVSTLGGLITPGNWPLHIYHPNSSLGQFIMRSPAGFNLQSEKYPAIIYLGNEQNSASGTFTQCPALVIPDIFHAEIGGVDSYGVFADSVGDRFMVVPYRTKEGTGNGVTGKTGYLIRNPDLTITIT